MRRGPDPDGPDYESLGVVGGDYEVIKNEQAFDFLTALAESGEANFETAGSLRRGSKVFVTMKLPAALKIVDEDHLDLYVAVSTTHDGSEVLSAFPTPVRVVCQNTLSLALKGNKRVQKVRHDARAQVRLAEAREILKVTMREGERVAGVAKEMLKVPVSAKHFDEIVAQHFVVIRPDDKRHVTTRRWEERESLSRLFRESPTQEVGRGTAWAAFNAISEWVEWLKPKDPLSRGSARSALDGVVAERRQRAFKLFGPMGAAS